MESPTRKECSRKNAHHSSSRSVPFVWIVCSTVMPGRRCFSTSSIARRKKGSPMIVGSPPCQAIVT